MLRPIDLVHILVNTPSAIHHGGKQFRFLLISAIKILARQFIPRLGFEMAFAVSNKIIDLLQVLLEGHVHRRGARKVHVPDKAFLLV